MFDFQRYEPFWREQWAQGQIDTIGNDAPKPMMVVPMFPYPSGKLHVGHVRAYTISDVQARYWRRRGYSVMHPFGWDAFGLPAENAAMKTGVHPAEHTERNMVEMKKQLRAIGMSCDWSRELATCDESYYRWTQWLFIQLYKHDLAYQATAPVNWCPTCQTALANEQVVNGPAPTQIAAGFSTTDPVGQCERCGTTVIARNLAQWFFRTTAFAEELLADLDQLPYWPAAVKVQQRHWIGKAEDGTYHLRDWLVSRQRYWGAPIPMIHCPHCGTVPVPELDLPVRLPSGVDFRPKGEPPLATAPDFVNTPCPQCGIGAHRAVETLDTFVDSAWYLYRYISPRDDTQPFDRAAVERWLPVETYVGGAEHAILHLMYMRFIAKALRQLGYLHTGEPVKRLFTLGMVYLDGAKMSKSKGNVVSQDEMVAKYGADSLRLWSMFMAPLNQMVAWSTDGIAGCHRLLGRLFALAGAQGLAPSHAAERQRHLTIERVTRSIESLHYNTAISAIMAFTTVVEAHPWRAGVETLVHLISPFAPFAAQELWHQWGKAGSIHRAPWPSFEPALTQQVEVVIPVQVNGKIKGSITVPADALQSDVESMVQKNPTLAAAVRDRQVKAYVTGRIISYQ